MWNREKATRLVRIVTKEYSKEIIAEGSKAVMGLEDHIDRIIAEILEIDSDIVTVAREWRKVIERATMTEGIDKVKIVLEQEIQDRVGHKPAALRSAARPVRRWCACACATAHPTKKAHQTRSAQLRRVHISEL